MEGSARSMGNREEEHAEERPSGGNYDPTSGQLSQVKYTPLFRAQHDARYRRQKLIRKYENDHDCTLVVMIDQITRESVTYLSECLPECDLNRDLHLLLCSPGGDPETAIRLIRMCQAVCRDFVIIVPEQAKSAATIMCLGASSIVLGATSDLGPIDPQIPAGPRGYVSAKDLIAAFDAALDEVSQKPDTFPIHAAMLGGIDATTVQFARSAMDRTGDIARQAIESHAGRSEEEVSELYNSIREPLIDSPKTHGALIGATEATKAGLPVHKLDPDSSQWQAIWEIWAQYFAIAPLVYLRAYEGRLASQVFDLSPVQ